MSKSAPSEKQIAANRANAAHSTGPRTPEGKARSARNSRKHGFVGAVFGVVRLEELDAVSYLKADLVSRLMSTDLVEDVDVLRAQNRNFALAGGFRQMVSQSDTWKLLRYQAQTERLYRRAIEEFERLKTLRAELPNEPILEAEPEPPQPLEPHPNEAIPAADSPILGPEEVAAILAQPPDTPAHLRRRFPARPSDKYPPKSPEKADLHDPAHLIATPSTTEPEPGPGGAPSAERSADNPSPNGRPEKR